MILWLASYPRSGNTLLRQVLHQCFGLASFEQAGAGPHEVEGGPEWEEARAAYGNRFSDVVPARFLTLARESADLMLVKTHELPPDEPDRAIYVVRDGRLALRSYVNHQKTYQGGSSFSELLLGDHVYRDWTTHYQTWCEQHRGPLLVLRFEELVNAEPPLLRRLAEFLDHRGEVRPWVNPQARLQRLVPGFFGPGSTRWRPDDFWTAEKLRPFYAIHGPLLRQLGYASAEEIGAGGYPAGSEEEHLALRAWWATQQRMELQTVCDQRDLALRLLREGCDGLEAEVELLRAEVKVLRFACDERLALIGRLEAECRKREDAIARQQRALAETAARLQEVEAEPQMTAAAAAEAAPWRKVVARLPVRWAA